MEQKIDREVATNEVIAWLDYKKISQKKRESKQEAIEAIVDAVCDGTLVIKDDKSVEHTLKFAIGDLTKVSYKPRLQMNSIHVHMQGVKSTDADGRVVAYIAALTSQAKEMIKKFDTEDFDVAQSIAIFFI